LAKLDVTVTYDARHGYIATALELRSPVVALSLGGLRRKIEALMVPDDVRCSTTAAPSGNGTGGGRRRN